MSSDAPRLVYLYCLLPAEASVNLDDIPAMEPEQPLRAFRVGPFLAVVSEVGGEFSESTLNTRVRDLDWLSPRAVRHHEVVDRMYAQSKLLLPLTFGAIFRSLDSLRQRLVSQHDGLLARLNHLHGREQWDLKLKRDEGQFAEALGRHSDTLRRMKTDLASKPPGTRFLLEKKLHNLQASEARRLSASVRADVHAALSSYAVEAQRDELAAPAQPQAARLELRSSYLIEEAGADGLKSAVEGLSRKYAPLGYSFDLTGPWPPFTFAGSLREALT